MGTNLFGQCSSVKCVGAQSKRVFAALKVSVLCNMATTEAIQENKKQPHDKVRTSSQNSGFSDHRQSSHIKSD